jgi:hypothetical protein
VLDRPTKAPMKVPKAVNTVTITPVVSGYPTAIPTVPTKVAKAGIKVIATNLSTS